MSLLDRYRSGECEEVWRVIVAERRSASDPEALAVAQETVLCARRNLNTIYMRLIELGYDFAEPESAFLTTTPQEAADDISTIENHYGPLPGLARVWYSHIRSVNFAQAESQCTDRVHSLRNLGLNPQAVFLSLDRCQQIGLSNHAQYVEWYQRTKEYGGSDTIEYLDRCCKTPAESARFLPLGSGASNNEHKGFLLPCETMDAEFYDDGEVTYFHQDLRYVIMAGGFPRLGSTFYRERVPEFMKFGHPDPKSLLAFLVDGLQPI